MNSVPKPLWDLVHPGRTGRAGRAAFRDYAYLVDLFCLNMREAHRTIEEVDGRRAVIVPERMLQDVIRETNVRLDWAYRSSGGGQGANLVVVWVQKPKRE